MKFSVQQGRASGSTSVRRSAQRGAALQRVEICCFCSDLKLASVVSLRVVYSTPMRLLISVLATLMASGEFARESFYRKSRSADMAVLIRCAYIMAILNTSPCQIYLA